VSSADAIRAQLAEHAQLVAEVSAHLADGIAELATRVLATARGGGKILFCGNGGSAADAQHLAAEYVVRFSRSREPIAALALTTDTSVLTAAGNDLGFERVFERQVRALARPGDLLVVHSISGASENVLRAVDAARELGVETAALLAHDGGPLRERVGLALVVPTESAARAQEMHLMIGHVVCELVDRQVAGGGEPCAG
jgi:D-sedoheptulose 7-phosphate isomerase